MWKNLFLSDDSIKIAQILRLIDRRRQSSDGVTTFYRAATRTL
jgi:hypothetical protein